MNGEGVPITRGLKDEFGRLIDPPTAAGVAGRAPEEILQLLPAYDDNADNPAFGLLVLGTTAHALRSGINFAREEHEGVVYQRGALRNVRVLETTPDFIRLEAHVEAQAAAFLRKQGLRSGTLFLNVAPCRRAGLGCYFRLPAMLEEGTRLEVFWPGEGAIAGRSFTGESDEEAE